MLCQPDVIDRARQAPHPRVRALLDLLATAETTYDDADDLRFILPGDSDRRGRRLDELEVPALGTGLSTSAATTNGMPMRRAVAASSGELSVPGMLDVVDQDETHSCPTERRRRGSVRPALAQTLEPDLSNGVMVGRSRRSGRSARPLRGRGVLSPRRPCCHTGPAAATVHRVQTVLRSSITREEAHLDGDRELTQQIACGGRQSAM